MGAHMLDVAIIGAGPYGLSLAAHLRRAGVALRIFGAPMGFWVDNVPAGTSLKSEGFASSLYDPDGELPLRAWCAERGIDYADVGLPVRVEHFIAYGQEFQRRFVPGLEPVRIDALAPVDGGFALVTAGGERLSARRVVVATGISEFAHMPAELAGLDATRVSHSSHYGSLAGFAGRDVAVLGAGASAFDVAAKLAQAGARAQLFARTTRIDFNPPPDPEPRPLLQRLAAPRSGLGIGWRSRACTDLPLLFHAMPGRLRLRAVERHLGPAPCWFIRDEVEGKVAQHAGMRLLQASLVDQRVKLSFQPDGGAAPYVATVDHVIAATGFRVALSRLTFLDRSLLERLDRVQDTPVLDRHFESSVPGLFFAGVTAANSFGPMLRFAYGAGFAARRLTRRLAA